jgi:ketosteroid isomerase-like protein
MSTDEADVTKLVASGKLNEAMTKVDAALAKKPDDARMRFSKGMILARQNKPVEAIAVLMKLTEDYPDLPEPYNNLAVLYAARAQYDKARVALDRAIQLNPGYVTAYENLGDVYAELAIQSYEKVAKLDGGSKSALNKLAMARSVTGSVAPPPTTATAAARTPTPSTPASAVAESPRAAGTGTGTEMMGRNRQAAATAAAVAAANSGSSTAAPAASAAASGNPENGAVLAAVSSWAKAWSDRDVKAYLASYSDDFETPAGQTRDAWAAGRTARIEDKKSIEVRVEQPQVSIDGDTATVKFRQVFISDKLRERGSKTLTLVKRGGGWMIKRERT